MATAGLTVAPRPDTTGNHWRPASVLSQTPDSAENHIVWWSGATATEETVVKGAPRIPQRDGPGSSKGHHEPPSAISVECTSPVAAGSPCQLPSVAKPSAEVPSNTGVAKAPSMGGLPADSSNVVTPPAS